MNFRLNPVCLALLGASGMACAAPAGTLLFSQPGVQIVNEAGVARAGKVGDLIESGEKLVTPTGVIGQVRLMDGSLLGVRPDTELKVELPPQASDQARNMLALARGAVRIINADMADGKKRGGITLETPTVTMQLINADAESRVVRPDGPKTAGVPEAGTYNRLLIGSGQLKTGSIDVPMQIRQVTLTPLVGVAPTTITALSPTLLFTSPITTTTLKTLSTTTTTSPLLLDTSKTTLATTSLTTTLSPTTSTLTTTMLTSPTLTTSLSTTNTLTNTLSTSTLSTSTLTKTTTLSPTLSTAVISPTVISPTISTTTLISPIISPTLSTTTLIKPTYTTYTCKTVIIGGIKKCI